jgi:uncharacterized repeat protein (TIGR01451 family)
VPFNFGWLVLNLNSGPGTTKDELKQSYVSAVSDAAGRFSVSNDGFRMAHPATQQPNPQAFDAPAFPGVTATKQVTGTFQVGQNITYTITLSRFGPGDRDCDLTDVLPMQLTLQSANSSSGTVAADTMTNTVTWNGMLSDATPMATVNIVATINANGGIFNTVTVAFDINGDAINDGMTGASRNFFVT